MAGPSTIEWTDVTWNPVTGCTKVSPGCDNCYAETIHERFNGPGSFATVTLHEDRLEVPSRWRKPRRVFVNSMSDLFHRDVPDEFIARVWAEMRLNSRHTFQILTKRHDRMRAWLNRCAEWEGYITHNGHPCSAYGGDGIIVGLSDRWPLPNVHLGVSVENQKWADVRIPALLETPAAVRWISAEPLLGPVDLTEYLSCPDDRFGHECNGCWLNWVVAGGESGPKARPPHPDWFRCLRNQCANAGVPFLLKQWGTYGELPKRLGDPGVTVSSKDGTVYLPGDLTYPDGPRYGEALRAGHGGTLHQMYRVGKKAAGRELDGRVWDEYPG